MQCYNCGADLTEKNFCTNCGADVSRYKKLLSISNYYYNDGLDKAGVRDLSGAIESLKLSLKFNKYHIEAASVPCWFPVQTRRKIRWILSSGSPKKRASLSGNPRGATADRAGTLNAPS